MYIDLIEEALRQAVNNPRTNEHSDGGTSEAENHTNDGRYFSIYPLNLNFFLFFPIIS